MLLATYSSILLRNGIKTNTNQSWIKGICKKAIQSMVTETMGAIMAKKVLPVLDTEKILPKTTKMNTEVIKSLAVHPHLGGVGLECIDDSFFICIK
jgi:hypothetical protein